MILRINQFDPANAEPYSGWDEEDLRGPVVYDWPEDSYAFEVLILQTDERHQPLPEQFRQNQLRQLLPDIVAAMMGPGEELVARLDGPVVLGEWLGALSYVNDGGRHARFGMSETYQLDDNVHA